MQPQNEDPSARWEHAANVGHPGAQYQLGVMYATGEQVQLDYIQAHKWLNLAAMQGSHDAVTLRAEITEEMTQSEVVAAQRLARKWRHSREAARSEGT